MLDSKLYNLMTCLILTTPLFPNDSLSLSNQLTCHTRKPVGDYVGKLEERWQFPSDHLPIGLSLKNLHIASWNVLDAKHIWRTTKKNAQGLQNSMLTDEHVYIGKTKLTVRDRHVVYLILEMIYHPTHPRSIIGLQECGKPFLEELTLHLPSHFTFISHGDNALIFNTARFSLIEAEAPKIFPREPKRSIQNIILQETNTGARLRMINVHIPGDPTQPGRTEFTNYLADSFTLNLPTIVLGDMNFNELQMEEALAQSFSNQSPFSLFSPYCTNIDPITLYSKAIDHFMVYCPRTLVKLNTAEEVLPSLEATLILLQKPKPLENAQDFPPYR